jgi:hypothetical protein
VPEPLVTNAADPDQLDHASRTLRETRNLELADLRTVLALPAGRRWFWRELRRHNLYGSVTRASSAEMYAASSLRDTGLEMLGEAYDVDPELCATMEAEARARARREERELAAVRTIAAADTHE